MTDQGGGFQVSQGFEVLPPKSGKAYPIPCEEWVHLKNKISKLTSEPWFFHTIGSILLGASLTTYLSIVLGTFSLPAQQRTLDIAWGVVAVTGVSGVFALLFAHKERGAQRERAGEVVAEMELIERRYEHCEP